MKIERYRNNPIIVPGIQEWRKVVTFNPGVVYDNGKFLLYERAAGTLRPFRTQIGLWESDDGKNFTLACRNPVFTSEMIGLPEGSVQDARVVKIEGRFYMCYAMQPFGFDCYPKGDGVPDYNTAGYEGWNKEARPMITRSGIAVSEDGSAFWQLCFTSPADIDDRDQTLFPEKIGGKFALLRRPLDFTGSRYGTEKPGIWLSYSGDLFTWSEPRLLAVSRNKWEGEKIGAAANPVKTDKGWLLLYHGVDDSSIYRVGAMLLDPDDPLRIIARTRHFIMEPEFYYEKTGLVIPNVVFPTGNVIVDNILYIYYGCCDTCISLATVGVEELIDYIMQDGRSPRFAV